MNAMIPRLNIGGKVIYNPIELKEFKYNEDKGDYYLFLARIMKEKGVHIAMDMAVRMGFNLKVAGDTEFITDKNYVEQLRQIAERHKNIEFLGNVTAKQKIDLLSNAKGLIFPCLWEEPLGIVPIEAMASGTPVLATSMGALPEVIGNSKGGICIDVNQFPQAFPELEKINPKDCLKRAKDFDVKKIGKVYKGAFTDIMAGKEW